MGVAVLKSPFAPLTRTAKLVGARVSASWLTNRGLSPGAI